MFAEPSAGVSVFSASSMFVSYFDPQSDSLRQVDHHFHFEVVRQPIT